MTGKGGVGKTTVASALATVAAGEGKRVLVCATDEQGNLAQFLGADALGFEPQEVAQRLFAMAMNTEDSLKEYLKLQLKVPLLSRIGPLAKTLDFVATAAPGVKEILTVGKLAWEVKERHYDLVVVDATASGHVVGQLASPVAMADLVSVGMVRQQTQWMIELLQDPATTGVVIATTPEEMPVNETLELIERISTETDINLAGVVANRVLPELFTTAQEAVFEEIDAPPGRAALAELYGDGAGAVIDAAHVAVAMRRGSSEHLDRLRNSLPAGVPLVYLPYLFQRTHGMRATKTLAGLLAQELL